MKNEVKFYSMLDFYPKREIIKKEYEKLTQKEKSIFKKEVYSICFEREYVKDLIWEYLNNWEESMPKLEKEWKNKKEKMEQKIKNEDNNTYEA